MLTISLTTFCGVDVLDLELSFGFLVNDVARLFGRRFDHNGRRLGLTRAQCRTLGYLARNEGINQAGMADLLEIRPMTLVRQIDRMEEAGWIERRPDPTDRRARRLFLTAKARPILGRIWNVANETRDEALALLSPDEAEILIDLLCRVHTTLSDRVPFGRRSGTRGDNRRKDAGGGDRKVTTSTDNEAPARGFRRVFGDRDAIAGWRARPLRQRLRLPLMLAGPIVVLIAASWWYLTSGRYVSTDDAYIQAARTMVSSDISGRVVKIAVQDNQRVSEGQVLFKLDDRPFRIAVEEATAMLAAAKLQVEALKATYHLKVADAKAAENTRAYQQREFERQRQLAVSGTASRQAFDQAQNAALV